MRHACSLLLHQLHSSPCCEEGIPHATCKPHIHSGGRRTRRLALPRPPSTHHTICPAMPPCITPQILQFILCASLNTSSRTLPVCSTLHKCGTPRPTFSWCVQQQSRRRCTFLDRAQRLRRLQANADTPGQCRGELPNLTLNTAQLNTPHHNTSQTQLRACFTCACIMISPWTMHCSSSPHCRHLVGETGLPVGQRPGGGRWRLMGLPASGPITSIMHSCLTRTC
mmetsp:Transcript_31005/g.68777  ORF Transcript_31005/g.68777 Transcript_31005/m.68777 type:complete len:225 (-) Transcript_31005:87-761(-)